MKKLFFILTSIIICASLCLCSCGGKKNEDTSNEKEPVTIGTENAETSENTENSAEDETKVQSILENADFEQAIKNLLGKDVITEDDLLSVYYISIVPASDGKCNLCIGLYDYIDAYYFELTKESPDPSALIPYAKDTDFVLTEGENLDADLAKFKNVEVFEFYELPVGDVSFIKNYENLVYGYFSANGIKNVSALSDYNPAQLLQLDLSGNPISDWTPLKHIEDKVIVIYSFEDGTSVTLKEFGSMTSSQFPSETTESKSEPTPKGETENTTTDENANSLQEEKTGEQIAEELGKQIAENLDLGALFE